MFLDTVWIFVWVIFASHVFLDKRIYKNGWLDSSLQDIVLYPSFKESLGFCLGVLIGATVISFVPCIRVIYVVTIWWLATHKKGEN